MAADEDVANSLKVWQLLWGTLHERLVRRSPDVAPWLPQVTWKLFVPLVTVGWVDLKLAVGPQPPWGLAWVPSLPPSFMLLFLPASCFPVSASLSSLLTVFIL